MRFDLDTVFYERDAFAEKISVKEYLKELLVMLWDEEEGFSGKRPFGNSGWQLGLAYDLAEDGFIDKDDAGEVDIDAFRVHVSGLIQSL